MRFLKSVKDEVKQVTWSSRKQLHKDTLVVVEASIVFGLTFYVMDIAIQGLFGWILK